MTPKKAIKIIIEYLEMIDKETGECFPSMCVPAEVKKAAEYLANLM